MRPLWAHDVTYCSSISCAIDRTATPIGVGYDLVQLPRQSGRKPAAFFADTSFTCNTFDAYFVSPCLCIVTAGLRNSKQTDEKKSSYLYQLKAVGNMIVLRSNRVHGGCSHFTFFNDLFDT